MIQDFVSSMSNRTIESHNTEKVNKSREKSSGYHTVLKLYVFLFPVVQDRIVMTESIMTH